MDHVRNQTAGLSVLGKRGQPSKRPDGTFSKFRNIVYLILLMITQVYIIVKIHHTDHLKSKHFFWYIDFKRKVKKRKGKKKKRKSTRSSGWFLFDPHISGLNICVNGD